MYDTFDRIYGINPVFEVVRAGRRQIKTAFLNKDGTNNPRLKKLAAFLSAHTVEIQWTDKNTLFNLCGTREHQGAVIEAAPFPYSPFAELIGQPRLILLDSIQDPHNVGAILRSAEAFGWHNALLPRRGAPLLIPSVIKSSAGAAEHLNVAVNCSPNQYVKIALQNNYTVVALDGDGKTSLEELKKNNHEKILLVAGGEDSGVSQFILNSASCIAAIPQQGHINSLNASVAAAIALYLLKK